MLVQLFWFPWDGGIFLGCVTFSARTRTEGEGRVSSTNYDLAAASHIPTQLKGS